MGQPKNGPKIKTPKTTIFGTIFPTKAIEKYPMSMAAQNKTWFACHYFFLLFFGGPYLTISIPASAEKSARR